MCKAQPGQSARLTTGNSRSSSARSVRRRCLRLRPRLASSRVNSTTRGVHYTGKRRQQRNEMAIPEERRSNKDNGAHDFGIVQAGIFGGRLRQNTASGEEEFIVSCSRRQRYKGKAVQSRFEKKFFRKVLRKHDVDPLIHTQSGRPLENSSRMEPMPSVLSSCAHWVS